MIKRWSVFVVLIITGLLFAGPAAANPVLVIDNVTGKLMGANYVQVDTNYYSVQFLDGTLNSLFGVTGPMFGPIQPFINYDNASKAVAA